MKNLISTVILIVLFINNLSSQTTENLDNKLDSLNKIISFIDKQVKELNDNKQTLKLQITQINQQKNKLKLEQEALEGIKVKVNFMGGALRDKPIPSGNISIKVPPGETITIYNWYEKPYFKAAYNEIVGFISFSSLEKNSKIESIVNSNLKKENPLFFTLSKKFGKYNAKRIMKGEYWIGMSREMARASLGKPDDNNKSTGSWGVHEQWVYSKKDLYIYFENGKLTSIQD